MTILLKASNLRPQLFSCFFSYTSLDVQTVKCIMGGEVWVQYYKMQTLVHLNIDCGPKWAWLQVTATSWAVASVF